MKNITLKNVNISKIIQIQVDEDNKKRLGFDYSINFINNNLINERCILCNSDIYFDSSLGYLKYLKDSECFALSRWNDTLQGSSLYNRKDSQDAWIFKGKIPLPECVINGDFELGRLGCDNRILEELHKSG